MLRQVLVVFLSALFIHTSFILPALSQGQTEISPVYREKISFAERAEPRLRMGSVKVPIAAKTDSRKSRRYVTERFASAVSRRGNRVSRGEHRGAGRANKPIQAAVSVTTEQNNHAEGIASYYTFKGGMRAACLLAPMGSSVKVTNLENGQSITVVVSDRGPFVKGRVIDLEKDAFLALFGTTRRGLGRVSLDW